MKNFKGVFVYMMAFLVITGAAFSGGKWADNKTEYSASSIYSLTAVTEKSVLFADICL